MQWLRVFRTVRHLRISQLAWRVRHEVFRRTGLHVPRSMAASSDIRFRQLEARIFPQAWQTPTDDAAVCAGAAQGQFVFLNRAFDVSSPGGGLDWSCNTARAIDTGGAAEIPSRLWKMNLQYFDFAAPLARCGDSATFLRLTNDWIAKNPVTARGAWAEAWNGYAIAARLSNWAYAAAQLRLEMPPRVVESLALQAEYLFLNPELDLLGNHLLRDCCGLLIAGASIEVGADTARSQRWRAYAYALLEKHLDRQVLADGGHYERSPMYHLLVMQDLAQSLALARQAGDCPQVLLEKLRSAVIRMIDFASAMQMGDGEIPLFSDSAFGIAPAPANVIAYAANVASHDEPARADRSRIFPDTGYAALRSDALSLIVSAGPLGPEEQPGHAHCDLASFVLSHGAGRIVEDTGVFEYSAGAVRDYERSTRAHNAVLIDGLEQGEFWGSFRLGRRSRVLQFDADADARTCRVRYQLPASGVCHERAFTLAGDTLTIEDVISGNGQHTVEWFLHFAPDMGVVQSDTAGFSVSAKTAAVTVSTDARLTWSAQASEFYPRFGIRQERRTIRGTGQITLPTRMRTTIVVREQAGLVTSASAATNNRSEH